jgi:hypothetical protein
MISLATGFSLQKILVKPMARSFKYFSGGGLFVTKGFSRAHGPIFERFQ